jgi:hypothetical protein
MGVPQEIKRPSGEITQVTRLLVSDETAIVSLSLWDDKSELAKELREGDSIELTGVSVRERQGENMLSLGKSGKLQKTSGRHLTLKGITELNALQQSKGLVTVEGTVADTPVSRQVLTEKGERIDLASFTLRDGTSSSRVTFWREQAANAMNLRAGVRVRIQGIRVRTGLSGGFELSAIPLSRLEILQEDAKDRPAWEDIRHVIALEPGLRTWVKGVVLEVVDDLKVSFLCESCGSELRFAEDELRCEKCTQSRSGRFVLSTHLRLDDGTGVIDAKLLCADAASLLLFDRKSIENQMLNSHISELQLSREQNLNLIGKEVELNGTAQPSPDHGKLEFIADRVVLANAP